MYFGVLSIGADLTGGFLAMKLIRNKNTKIALKDTTLDTIEEKLKKHKLIGGRHKRTNKKNPPIV